MLKITKKNQVAGISVLLFALLQHATGNAIAAEIPVPSGVSDLYSDIDMRVRLSAKASALACVAEECAENSAFDARIDAIGRYLSKAALMAYPQKRKVIDNFNFSVADKLEAGTVSNNKGQIVVFRGVQGLQLSDDALGFVITREMSHVLAGHHVTNTSTKLIISTLASVLFPAFAIIGASSAAAQASSATTLISSAASTATSMVGSEVVMAQMKPSQLNQADEMARNIMEKNEWDMRSVESVLTQDGVVKGAWMLDLQASRYTLKAIIEEEDASITDIPADYVEDDSDIITVQYPLPEI